ncbi:MAG: cobalamin-dependent protein [Oscillospiraceae bacterium]|nr:cobalamin-dependent protein [Oscillospiraceae bacterium]
MELNLEQIKRDMGDLEREAIIAAVTEYMKTPHSEEEIGEVLNTLSSGMQIVSKRFDEFDYFIGDLIFAGLLLSDATDILTQGLSAKTVRGEKKVLLCTVEGDLHNIGKNMVFAFLSARGVPTLDIGVDVPPRTILETIKTKEIAVLAMSGVLSTAVDSMRATVQCLQEADLRDTIKIVIGGTCANEAIAAEIGVDAYCSRPEETAALCRKWLDELEGESLSRD